MSIGNEQPALIPPQEPDEKKEKKISPLLIILACCLLFPIWFQFLYPWVPYQFYQSDSYWLIEIGRHILQNHCLPTHDIYSFASSTAPWIVYQWLTEVMFALANWACGLTGVSIFGMAIMATLFCVLIFRRALSQGTNAFCAITAIWFGAYAFYPDMSSLRPQLFSFLFFWLLNTVCADAKAGPSARKSLIYTFIIALVWANCHVSFPIAFVVLGLHSAAATGSYLLKRGDKQQALLFATMCATFLIGTLITPYGFSLWSFIFTLKNLYTAQELMPVDWAHQSRLITFLILVVIASVRLNKKVGIANFLIMLTLFIMGSQCVRLMAYFDIFCVPLVGAGLTLLFGKVLNDGFIGRLSNSLKAVAMSRFYAVAILLLSTFTVLLLPLYQGRDVPLQAADYLQKHPITGNLFCSAHAGSYLMYSSQGTIPVFIDTRLDLYDAKLFERLTDALYKGRGWQELFAQYKIAAALVPNNTLLRAILTREPHWELLYQDRDFSLFSRRP